MSGAGRDAAGAGLEVAVCDHPLLEALAFVTDLPAPLGELTSPPALVALLDLDADTPLAGLRTDEAKRAVRDLLRHAGFKPTGRSKPACEYLVKAAEAGRLGPINPAVDCCNAASLHGALPISVVDLERAAAPFRIEVAPPGSRYVFNPSGQEIDVSRLLCLCDAAGPCANAVKDGQRTKTSDATRRTLSVVWGTRALEGRTEQVAAWYRGLLAGLGAKTAPARIV